MISFDIGGSYAVFAVYFLSWIPSENGGIENMHSRLPFFKQSIRRFKFNGIGPPIMLIFLDNFYIITRLVFPE